MTVQYSVIGWPLGHSMSPAIHNASFEALGLKCRFDAHPVSPAQFDQFMKSFPSSRLKGLAVTIPYKTEVLKYCGGQEREVEIIGAANTICLTEAGVLKAYNTDAAAASRTLLEAGVVPEGKRVVVLGAGGAARAICFQMLWDGAAELTIANRTVARAESLKKDLQAGVPWARAVSAIPLDGGALSEAMKSAQIVINTTSVGMYPRVGESPVDVKDLKKDLAVLDIVYNPLDTQLLKGAREAGAAAISGTEMLIYQAAEQEKIWLGVDAPIGVMREALLKGLERSF